MKVKGEAFEHPFYELDLPSNITEEEKPSLILKIRAGDRDAAHRVVLSHTRLALGIVGRYLTFTHNTSESDDLVSAAIEGLCYAVNRIKKSGLPHDNLTGYLTETIHSFISDYLDHLPVVRVPGRTRRDRKRKGLGIKQPGIRELTETVIEKQFGQKNPEMSAIEFQEILEKISQSPTEKEIIRLRMEGHKDDAIADQIGLSKTSVFLIRRELEVRFVELFGG